jgi:AraC-like DNA-binding protein
VRVIAVSSLLRELTLRACALPVLYDESGPAARIMTLILDEIAALPTVGLDLPMPRDARLRRICAALRAEPGSTRTLESWARATGASSRTLARRFVRETRLTFAEWRQQARLLDAMARLAAGQPVTAIALDLGYDSPSAFAAMFRRALGTPPSRYLSRSRAPFRGSGRPCPGSDVPSDPGRPGRSRSTGVRD